MSAITNPPRDAALVEVRTDLFPDLDISAAVSACPLPVLATYRSAAEGGQGSEDPEIRHQHLFAAATSGAALVDLEWARDRVLSKGLGLEPERQVLSWHDTEGTPGDLKRIAREMLAEHTCLVKVVPTCLKLADLESILSLSYAPRAISTRERRRLIAFSMGAIGVPSRFLAPLRGAPIGFSAWSESAAAAPGQLTAERMESAVGHLQGPPRHLFGVVGRDVSRSLSPALHAAGYRARDLPDLMVPISVADPDELGELFTPAGTTLFDRLGLETRGWAVTTPYKREAAQAATVCAPRVRQADAANTLVLGNNRILAENTDADGVVGSLTAAGVSIRGMRAIVQGTGGAARGAAVGLFLAGADVMLRSRDDLRGKRIADAIGVESCRHDHLPGAEILVNATPLGKEADNPLPFDEQEIETAQALVDMVYGLQPTALERKVSGGNAVWIDGKTMLAYQGIAQFAAFTGSLPPREEMLRALD